jgi:uncharacterized membrane protein
MKARRPLAILFIIAGALLPVLTRWIDPHASPLLTDRRSLIIFCALSAIPFLILAIFTWLHLRRGEASHLRRRLIAILVAFVAIFALGLWIHLPKSVPGENFAVFLFPVYGALLAPIAYAVGRLVTR